MNRTTATPAQIALAEFTRRRANAARAVAAGRKQLRQAEAHVRLWAGIAAWFGAVLPDDCRPFEGWQLWTDHAPTDATPAQWRAMLAAELRRAALTQLALTEQQGAAATPETLTRARQLLALDHELSIAAGLPAIGAAPDQPERKAA